MARGTQRGVLRVDASNLRTLEVLPPEGPPLSPDKMEPESSYPGIEVRTKIVRSGGLNYVLRWETLPSNRDRPRDEAPPPSELRLFEVAAAAEDGVR